jgi:DNA invertase Pin-like site-specific DNA recombinase
MMKVAIYARVNTDWSQTAENQLTAFRAVGERLGGAMITVHANVGILGAKGRDSRPGFDALLLGVARKEFDLIAAWLVDRLGRSLQDLIGFLSDIQARGVDLYLHQQGVDTSTPSGRMLFQLLSVFAEFERSIIRDRVLSGLQRAKAKGTRIGRPPMPPAQVRRIQEALAGGAGVRQVARLTGASPTTVSRIRQTMLIEQQEQQVVAA